MGVLRNISRALAGLALFVAAGCGAVPPASEQVSIDALRQEISALAPTVDPQEAARAAQVALLYSRQLARDYNVTDPPLIHNTKVNMGLRPRGLCWHWAQDLEKRLAQEQFETLELHRAVANAENPILLEHSTVLISSKGASMFDGLVLDPWRKGGTLTWASPRDDAHYKWRPRDVVLAEKRARKAR